MPASRIFCAACARRPVRGIARKRNGRKIVLVDDVPRTGATVEECSHMLLDAGAARVDVLTLRRVKARFDKY
jgi:predicted amidophosphoribosyltransferase